MSNLCKWFRNGDWIECGLCGKKLPGRFPTTTKRHCQAKDESHKTLVNLIDACPHRGEDTGREVTCGCASMPKQPVFLCAIHGEAIRYKTSRTDYGGKACIECDVPREQLRLDAEKQK